MESVVRYTTPTFKVTFDTITVSSIAVAYLVFKQGNVKLLELDLESATVGDKYLSWKLTQEQASLFSCRSTVKVVCDWKLADGTRGRSDELFCSIKPPGKNEVI